MYEFIADCIPAKVEGRDIGEGLKKLVTRWKARSFAVLSDAINNFQERETVKYRAKEQESRAVSIEDKVKCLHIMIERTKKNNPTATNPVDAVCAEIDSIFADNIRGGYVLLSSIHKSKGREFDRVFSIDVGPSPWARKDWELEQEKNLKYVEVTRAKKEFIIFHRPKKK